MKKILLLMLGLIMIASSCKKDPPDPDPTYPQLIGNWKGYTSQETPIEFSVINIKGTLYISHYKLTVLFPGGDSKYEETNDIDGIATLNDVNFLINLDANSTIAGTFDATTMLLAGTFSVTVNTSKQVITGTFACSKDL